MRFLFGFVPSLLYVFSVPWSTLSPGVVGSVPGPFVGPLRDRVCDSASGSWWARRAGRAAMTVGSLGRGSLMLLVVMVVAVEAVPGG